MNQPISWRSGDRAYCIKRGEWSRSPSAADTNPTPVYGVTYLVTGVSQPVRDVRLSLAGFNWHHWFNAKHFRKVVPACDRKAVGRADTFLSEQQ